MRSTEQNNPSAALNTQQNESDSLRSVKTRFGEIIIDLAKAVNFPSGLLGIAGHKYCLANFPNKNFDYFKILQSIENEDLAFLIYPVAALGVGSNYDLLSKEDLEMCAKEMELPMEQMLVLLITSVYQIPNHVENTIETTITVNLRAPLIIDTRNNNGVQYVFHNDKYSIRHVIYGDNS